MRWTLEGEWVTTLSLVGLVSGTKLRRVGRNTQFGGAGSGQVTDTFSALLGETLLLFPPQPYSIIQRARDRAGNERIGGWVRVRSARIHTQTVLNKIHKMSARLLPLESLPLAEEERSRRGVYPEGAEDLSSVTTLACAILRTTFSRSS